MKPNSIKLKEPHLEAEWHSTKNGDVKFEDVSFCSAKKRWWKCALGHEWEAHPANRTSRKSRCPYCAGKRVSDLNSLRTRAPRLESEWHPTKNGDVKFDAICFSSHKERWWQCGADHEWLASPNRRTALDSQCPYCSGHRVSNLNSLRTQAPHLESEWHPTKNGDVKFEDVSYGSTRKYWWICSKGHEWVAWPNSRTAMKSGCPHCFSAHNAHSMAELDIFAAVKDIYPDAKSGIRSVLKNKRFELDIYIPSLRKAIEYDGTYWHSDPVQIKLDLQKDEQCSAAGIKLLRITEAEYEADRSAATKKALDFLDAQE